MKKSHLLRLLGCSGLLCAFSLVADQVRTTLPATDLCVDNGVFNADVVYGEPGQPKLPVYVCDILLPPDADQQTVSVTLQNDEMETLEGVHSIAPAMPPTSLGGQRWPANRNIFDYKDLSVYGVDAYHPQQRVQIIENGELHCYKIVKVRVNLCQYNPVSGTLRALKQGTLSVSYEKQRDYDAVAAKDIKMPLSVKKEVKDVVVNYHEFAPAYDAAFTTVKAGKYVIITTSSVKSQVTNLDKLIESKKKKGFDVEVVLESTWGGGTGATAAGKLRKWLQDNYKTKGITHGLLIGSPNASSGDVPMKFESDATATAKKAETDYVYGQLNDPFNGDSKAEVHIGRLPVFGSASALNGIIDRIIAYENAPKANTAWRRNALFAAEPYDASTPCDDLFEAIKTKIVEPKGWKCKRMYKAGKFKPEKSPCSEGNMVSLWKSGSFGLVAWTTHGAATLAQGIMSSGSSAQIGSQYPSIVYMGSCLNAELKNSNNLAYAMFKNQSVCTFGGTQMTEYEPGEKNWEGSASDQGFAYNFSKAVIENENLGAGEAMDLARSRSKMTNWWLNHFCYNCYGCPDTGIGSCAEKSALVSEEELLPTLFK